MTAVLYDNMTAPAVFVEGSPLPVIVNAPNGPFAAGTQPRYVGQLTDSNGQGMALANLATFTLTLVDTLTGYVINGVEDVDILNTGRGLVDDGGVFRVTLTSADTNMDDVPDANRVTRSLVLTWTTTDFVADVGRHQANFILARLAA